MRVWLFFIFTSALISATAFANWEMKINLGKRPRTTVYSEDGHDYFSCQFQNNQCADVAVGWPDNSATIEPLLGADGKPQFSEMEQMHPYYQRMVRQKWYLVNVSYDDPKKGKPHRLEKKGVWMQADDLKINKIKPKVTKKSEPPCPPGKNQRKTIEETAERFQQASRNDADSPHEKKLDEMTNKLNPLVGQCTYDPPLSGPKPHWDKDTSIYAQEVLPVLKKNEKKLPSGVSLQQYAEVDVLARTIYGEMAQCYGQGSGERYLQAVGRLIINRADEEASARSRGQVSRHANEAKCFKLKHSPNESPLISVVTAARQFNPWDLVIEGFRPKGEGKNKVCGPPVTSYFNKNSLRQTLCPPSNPNKFWNSKAAPTGAPEADQAAWQASLRIATEAILFSDKFKDKTRDIVEAEFRSELLPGRGKNQSKAEHQEEIRRRRQSNIPKLAKFNGKYRVVKSIDGEPLDRPDCMILYGSQELHLDQAMKGIIPSAGRVKKIVTK